MKAVKGRWYIASVQGEQRVIKVTEVGRKRHIVRRSPFGETRMNMVNVDDDTVGWIDRDGITGRLSESMLLRRTRPGVAAPYLGEIVG